MCDEKFANIKEVLIPVWSGDICLYESILPTLDKNGKPQPIQLLYPIDEIIEVRNAMQTEIYQKEVDYTVIDGKFVFLSQGRIEALSYDEMHPQEGRGGFEATEGGYLCFYEGSWYHSKQLVVSYRHPIGLFSNIPKSKGYLLPRTHKLLQERNQLDLFVFGDSISVGANSSGCRGIMVPPYQPIYCELFAEGLKDAYKLEDVRIYNPSVGGKNTQWAIEQIDEELAKQENIDLAIVAFGMNDIWRSFEEYVANIKILIEKIKAKNALVEIIVIAPMLPNPNAKRFYGNQVTFADALLKNVEETGVAVADMTTMHQELLKRKRYEDMTGNNVNHPNDFLARVYAQTLLKTLQK